MMLIDYKLFPVFSNMLDTINTERKRLVFILFIHFVGNQIEIGIHHRYRPNPMWDPFPIRPIVFNGNLFPVGNAVHQLSKSFLYTFAAVFDFPVTVKFLTDQFFQLRTVIHRRKLLVLINQGKQFHPRKSPCPNQYFDQSNSFRFDKDSSICSRSTCSGENTAIPYCRPDHDSPSKTI